MNRTLVVASLLLALASCAQLLGIDEATVRDASVDAAVADTAEELQLTGIVCDGAVCSTDAGCCVDKGTCALTTTCSGPLLRCDSYATCGGGVCCLVNHDGGNATSTCGSNCALDAGGFLMCLPGEQCLGSRECLPILLNGKPGYYACQ